MISPVSLSSGAVLATLAQAVPAIRDTVVTVQASSRGLTYWVDLLTSIASIVIALALIAIAIPVVPAAWNSRKVYAKINQVIERLREDVNPVVRHAASVADNVDYISASLRADIQTLNQTIASANQRVNRVAALAEERVNELNALLEVVQEEAESLFIDTASTVRGVRTGAEAFRRFRTDGDADLPVEGEDAYDDADGGDDGDDGLDTDFGRRG
ncbi:MAG TPA: hypothetical protein VHG28_07505 [Longimicrobiaceae bacterium]|nr:hypothetical protein [Longimicrobiaceae bacterium]